MGSVPAIKVVASNKRSAPEPVRSAEAMVSAQAVRPAQVAKSPQGDLPTTNDPSNEGPMTRSCDRSPGRSSNGAATSGAARLRGLLLHRPRRGLAPLAPRDLEERRQLALVLRVNGSREPRLCHAQPRRRPNRVIPLCYTCAELWRTCLASQVAVSNDIVLLGLEHC